MKSILVIGMGRFGRHLALKMQELGNNVMIVDKDEAIVNEMSNNFVNALIGDCTKASVLKEIGVNNFDICFVTMADNFQSSLEITCLLQELGAKYVVSKAGSDIQAKFLLKNGANEVVYPDKDMAHKTAIRFNANNVFDYIELTDEYGVFEIAVLPHWIGHSILELNVRKNYHVSIIAVKSKEDTLNVLPESGYVFQQGDHIILVCEKETVEKLK